MKQLVLRKFFDTIQTVNCRQAMERWKLNIDVSGRRRRDYILDGVSHYYRSATPSKGAGAKLGGVDSVSAAAKTTAGAAVESAERQRSGQNRRGSLRQRIPRNMLAGIKKVKEEKAVIKFKTGTVEELMDMSRGVRHKKNISGQNALGVKSHRIPSQNYFLKACGERDRSVRSDNLTASELKTLSARTWY